MQDPVVRRRQAVNGQAMVEMALAIPLLLLCIFGVIYFGRFFYISQALLYAAQEGARVATRIPNLRDEAIREYVRGFSTAGAAVNPDSVIYSALGAARLLSNGASGDLPARAKVKILPWDSQGSQQDYTPPGTIAVRIEYPFELLGDPFAQTLAPELRIATAIEGQGEPVPFLNVLIAERATVCQEIFQEVD